VRVVIKKIYCSHCRLLVKGEEKPEGRNTLVYCSKCARLLHFWNGIFWKPVRDEKIEPQKAA